MLDKDAIRRLAVETLDENKALKINTLDVGSLTNVTDYMIVCSASSSRHASSLADHLVTVMKAAGVRPLGLEGQEKGEWILVDLQDVVVHIMLEEVREFYNLEKLWSMTEHFRQQHEH